VNEVASAMTDPETGATVEERLRAKVRVDAMAPDAGDSARETAKRAADAREDFPIDAVGSGSDYTGFVNHLGVPALNLEYTGEANGGGAYHSRYDTFEHFTRFSDPGFVYDSLLARTVGRMMLRASSSDAPLQRAGDFADAVAGDLSDVKRLAEEKGRQADIQAGLLRDRAFALASDPARSHALPTALKAPQIVDLTELEQAVGRLKVRAKRYDTAFAAHVSELDETRSARLRALMRDIDQTLAPDVGLPGRPWYKNLVYAPGRFTGYGVKTLPGVREAIEEQRYADARRYTKLTAAALDAYSARLELATAVLSGH
jgi:N-acetylated-alpha-linked acidic dipeptidase